MRALESLIKRHGGWKNVKKIKVHTYDYLFNDFIENLKKQNGLNESDIKNKDELFKLFTELAEHVIIAYDKLKADGTNPCSHFPLCFVIALAFNMACHEFKNIKGYEESISNHEKWIRKEIAKYERNDKKALAWYFEDGGDNIYNHPRGEDKGFTWCETPEGMAFWSSVRDWLSMDNLPKSSNIFFRFTNAHPDSKEEIKEFYKK